VNLPLTERPEFTYIPNIVNNTSHGCGKQYNTNKFTVVTTFYINVLNIYKLSTEVNSCRRVKTKMLFQYWFKYFHIIISNLMLAGRTVINLIPAQ
jgi:hypothetical protein